MKEKRIKKIVLMSMMIAMSAVGAYIIVPSPAGTVALDSAPGYLASLLFGGINGAVVLFLGHLISALKSGFPLGILHILIALLMGGCGLAFYYLTAKTNYLIGSLIVIILNGVVTTAALIPFLGYGFFLAMLIPLLTGSMVNVILAVAIRKLLEARMDLNEFKKEDSRHG